MPVSVFAISRQYVWRPVTSTADLDDPDVTVEAALIVGPTARPAGPDWTSVVVDPHPTASTWWVGLLVGVDTDHPIEQGVDYELWLRVEAGAELIVLRSDVVTGL